MLPSPLFWFVNRTKISKFPLKCAERGEYHHHKYQRIEPNSFGLVSEMPKEVTIHTHMQTVH